MLPRAKSFPALSLILAASLAWPANIPLFAPPDPPRISTARPTSPHADGRSVGRHDRDSHARWSEVALVAGDLEESDGFDWPRIEPIATAVGALDLPSLVPSPLPGRPIEVTDEPARAPRSPRLRC